MPTAPGPILSVIVRRFGQGFDDDVRQAVARIQQAVVDQPGFVGLQNSLSHRDGGSELVTVFAFDSRKHLDAWERSEARRSFVRELDSRSQDSSTHTQFGDLALLLSPKAELRKIEVVAILIFWILALGSALKYLAGFLWPETLAPFWRNAVLVSVNVGLISYVFLPWSSRVLTNLKTRASRKTRNT